MKIDRTGITGTESAETWEFELTPAFWSGLLQIIMVNIVLSGDNALVIALACRNLEKRHQKPAILIGSAGAIVLRIIFVLIVDQLLKIGYLKLIGGLLLLWIGVKLVQGEEEHGDGVRRRARCGTPSAPSSSPTR